MLGRCLGLLLGFFWVYQSTDIQSLELNWDDYINYQYSAQPETTSCSISGNLRFLPSFLLFLPGLTFGNISAVHFSEHVLRTSADGIGNNLCANGCLNNYFKHLSRDEFFELGA